ncbi:angiopoietin-4-like isoform X1 [Suricata suricatta]|uniref:angiopoietin-4-like isoform X1 n=1 Tax=Suricata suricatta TaxID=37032 RepID=UPI0011553720|nr:angiopoietin-4-like isoform X1 [Suricata suricatta]
MAAHPMLALVALLCSVPQAGSTVKRRQPVQAVLLEPQGRDCSQIWTETSGAPSGVYAIQPEGAGAPFQALCDMREDGGWTLIQSRDWGRRRRLDFERCWQEYKQGFGDLTGDHWLGLEHISDLTSQPGLRSELLVDLLGVDNRTLQAHYDDFHVAGEDLFYRLTLGLYSGNAGCRSPGVRPGVPDAKAASAAPRWELGPEGQPARRPRSHPAQGTRSGAPAAQMTKRAVASARWTATMTAARPAPTAQSPSPAAATIARAPAGGTVTAARLTSMGCGRRANGPSRACAGPWATTSPPCAPACCECAPLLPTRPRPVLG